MNPRQPLATRAFVIALTTAALVLAGCGGGDSESSGSTATNGEGGSNTTTTNDGGDRKCFTTPGTQKARVRFVNFYTNATYPEGDIDIWQGGGASDGCGKKLTTVPYGTASDYIDVTAGDEAGNWSATAFVAGSPDDDHQIITQTQTWTGGEQLTLVFHGGDPASPGVSPASGSVQGFFEVDNEEESSAVPTVPGKAVLEISATATQYVLKDKAWVPGVAGTPGCLLGIGDTETTRTNIYGTSGVAYPVAPGSLELSLYPANPATCVGAPDIGPVTIDAGAGSRTLVFVWGPDAERVELLVLPIED